MCLEFLTEKLGKADVCREGTWMQDWVSGLTMEISSVTSLPMLSRKALTGGGSGAPPKEPRDAGRYPPSGRKAVKQLLGSSAGYCAKGRRNKPEGVPAFRMLMSYGGKNFSRPCKVINRS